MFQAAVRRSLTKLATSARKRLRLEHSLSELEPDLAAKELIFRSPPMTREMVAAVKLISPQFHLRPTERSRDFWGRNQNGLCWGEYEALAPFLDRLERPGKVLDIGPGLGRSTIFFKKVRGWESVPFHLYEGSGEMTKYTKAGDRFADSFCGDFNALAETLRYNEITDFEIFDASALGASLKGLPGVYDFVYSFFAVGFHWALEHFLDEILERMSERAIGAFTLHDLYTTLHPSLERWPHRIVEFRGSWPRGRRRRILMLAKSEGILDGEPAVAPAP
ncbi:MAG: hypothetical protein OEW19_13205 [Acidobacteriota bacterium]|nr:hypothetical protein [Acidobacteriota bacterium]